MIGSVLFYVFYPLSRYWLTRNPEAARKKDLNGTSMCDGEAVTAGMFTQSQATLSDPWLTPGIGAELETKGRLNESNPEMGKNAGPVTDKEHSVTVQYTETTAEVAPRMNKVEEERETKNKRHQVRVEDPTQSTGGKIESDVLDMKQNAEGGCVLTIEDTDSDLGSQLGCLLLKKDTLETTCPVQKTIRHPSLEEPVSPSQHRLQHINTPADEPQECWDNYGFLTPDVVEKKGCVHPFTHIPAGPGFVQEVPSPLWLCNDISSYLATEPLPTLEDRRVWQESVANVSKAEPDRRTFPFPSASMDFTVMSYNILADDLLKANLELYTHCPWEVLDWRYRCRRILMEIQKWAPDILCLQEVQETHFYEHLHPVLSQWGYNCEYKRRTGTKTDGCATCYRVSCFSEVSVSSLEFYRPETKLLDRHNVAIVSLLRPSGAGEPQSKATGPELCVVNTHLLFNPGRGDVKLAQVAILLAEMDRVVRSLKARGQGCNLILCGDFNSVPLMPLYQLITTGQLYYQGLPAWKISGQEDRTYRGGCHRLFAPLWPSSLGVSDGCQYTTVAQELKNQKSQKTGQRCYSHDFLLQMRFSPAACVRPLDLELIPGVTDNIPDPSRDSLTDYDKCFSHILRHQLDLKSVYSHFLPGSGDPEVTTLLSEVGATVDYIFYSPRRNFPADQRGTCGLKLTGSLSLLSEEALRSVNGLPNATMPSDHLSLLAKFQMDLKIT